MSLYFYEIKRRRNGRLQGEYLRIKEDGYCACVKLNIDGC